MNQKHEYPLFQCLCAWGHYSTHHTVNEDQLSDWSCPHETKTFEGVKVCSSRLVWINLVENEKEWETLVAQTFAIPADKGVRVKHPELEYWEKT